MRDMINPKTNARMFAFDSMSDIVRYIDPDKFRSRGKDFVGEELASWCDVLKRSERCWAEGMYVLQQYIDKLSKVEIPEIKSCKRKSEYSTEDGDEVEWERLMSGEAFYRKCVRAEKMGPNEITIITDTTTPAFQKSDNILWRGAAALALTKILEERGYTVELWVVNGSELFAGKDNGVCTGCCLKRCSDPLDTSTLVNVVAGWFYRTITFALLDTLCEKHGESVAYGYGSCYSPKATDLDLLSRDENRVYSSGCYSFSSAADMVVAELQKFKDRKSAATESGSND